MLRVVTIAAALLCSSSAAHATEWQPLARQCAEEVEQQAGCTSACTNTTWAEVARCANFRLKPRVPQDVFERCVRKTKRARPSSACPLCGDPVAEVFACAER